MDETRTHNQQLLEGFPDSGFFRLDRARNDFVAQLGDIPLTHDESRLVLWALAMWDYDTLEGFAGLLAKVRRDGP